MRVIYTAVILAFRVLFIYIYIYMNVFVVVLIRHHFHPVDVLQFLILIRTLCREKFFSSKRT